MYRKGAMMLSGAVLICTIATAVRADPPRAAVVEARIRGELATASQQLAAARMDRDAVKEDCIRRDRALLDQYAASIAETSASLARTASSDAAAQKRLLARIAFLSDESDRTTRDISQCAGTRRVSIAQAGAGAGGAGDSAVPPPPPPPPPAPPEQKPAPKFHYNPFNDCNILGIWSCVTAPIEYDSFASPSK